MQTELSSVLLWINIISMLVLPDGNCYSMNAMRYLCPQGYHTNNGSNQICQFCPYVGCYVMKGKSERNESQKGYYIDCMHYNNLPLEKYVAQKLDCVLMGNYSSLNLFIYPIPLDRRELITYCLKPDFIKPLSQFIEKFTLISIDIGVTIKKLPTFLLLSIADYGKNLKTLRFKTSATIRTDTIFYYPFTSPQPQIYVQTHPKREERPSKNMTICRFKRRKTFAQANCQLPSNSVKHTRPTIPQASINQMCPYELDRPAKQKDLEEHNELIDTHSEFGILVLMALSLVSFCIFLVLSSIFIYYLKHFSKFSPRAKEARAKAKLEKANKK